MAGRKQSVDDNDGNNVEDLQSTRQYMQVAWYVILTTR